MGLDDRVCEGAIIQVLIRACRFYILLFSCTIAVPTCKHFCGFLTFREGGGLGRS